MRRIRYSVAMSLDGYIAEPATSIKLTLKGHTVYEKTGTVGLVYTVNNAAQP